MNNANIYSSNSLNKCCKKAGQYYINNKFLCHNHCVLQYKKYIVIIQKWYKGYKCRRYLNNIYYKLPYELQAHISKFINKKHYDNMYNRSIYNIIIKKRYLFIIIY